MDLKTKIFLVGLLSLILIIIQSGSTLASGNNKSRLDANEVKPSPKPQTLALGS